MNRAEMIRTETGFRAEILVLLRQGIGGMAAYIHKQPLYPPIPSRATIQPLTNQPYAMQQAVGCRP